MAALPILKRPDPSRLENRLFIDNQFVEATSSTSIQLHDPSTEEPTISFLSASQSDVDRAVTSSLNAFKNWSKTSPSHRSLLLRKLADLVRENAEELSSAESICMGKPANISSSLAAAAGIDHYAGLASTLEGKTDVATDGVFKLSIKQPYGVVAAIVPWNSPLLLTVNKLIPALLAGNTVIIKTSERSPLCLLALAKLCVKAGLGPGVVNVLNGGGDVGNMLALHPLIRKISLTGSIPSGRSVVKASASSNLKSVGLELGGKSPSIVFSDADLSLALKSIEVSAVYNLAQVCMSTTRLLIQEEIAEEFTRRFIESYTSKVPSGSFEKSCIMGPLVDKRALKSVEGFIESARSDGGKIYDLRNSGPNGGKRLEVEDIPSQGYFIRPTVITGLGRNSRCVKEEIFGPVVVILTFKDEEEAIELANDSEYGLYGSVFTQNGARALRVAKALEVGSVGINKTSPAISLDQSFGGWKQSGWGKEMGNDALEEFLQTKSIDYVL